MKSIQVIENLIPFDIIQEIGDVLKKGSSKEGKKVLNCHRSRLHYLWKFSKHLGRYGVSLLTGRPPVDSESKRHHLTHCILRLCQLLGVELKKIKGDYLYSDEQSGGKL